MTDDRLLTMDEGTAERSSVVSEAVLESNR